MKSMCDNCLEVRDDVKPVEIGPDKGSQRDPYRERLDLCGDCSKPLLDHDLPEFHARYVSVREIELRRGS
jgi:hypothetical protein